MLQPVAAPAVLGWLALASALVVFGSWFSGVWGTEKDAGAFFPFLLFFGGFGQLAAALWSYRARAATSAALHGSWAAFWLGLSLVYLLETVHAVKVPPRGAEWQSLGEWLFYMAIISATTAFAALARSRIGFVAQGTLTTAAALAAAGLLAPSAGLQHAAGWVFVAAAVLGFLIAARLMLGSGEPVEYAQGDPGVKVGQ